MLARLEAYTKLMRLHRPWPILLILFSTYWGLFLGPNRPTIFEVVIFTVGVVLTRSAGCVINDYFDRKIDGKIKRTKMRPLQLLVIKPKEAVVLFVILMALAFCVLLFLKPIVILMGVAAFFFTLCYPLAKRFTHFPQLVLGITFNFGLLMADLQVNGQVSLVALAYYVFAILWTVHYDTLYALCDYEDDLKIGVKSIPTFFKDKVYTFLIWTSVFLVFLLMLAFNLSGFSIVKNMVLFIFTGFLVYQYRELSRHGNAVGLKLFTQNVWMGFLILLGVLF